MPVGPTLKTVKKPGRLADDLDTHPVAGVEPDLVGGRWDLLHVAGQAAGRRLRMGRGDGYEVVRADLAADDQTEIDGGRLGRLGYCRRLAGRL